MNSLKKPEEDGKASVLRVKQIQEKLKKYKYLSDAVSSMSDKVEKAVRDMRNLAARKTTAQPAFEKWYRQYCEPSKALVDLVRQVEAEPEAVQEREERAVNLAQHHEGAMAALAEELQQYTKERREWYLQKGVI